MTQQLHQNRINSCYFPIIKQPVITMSGMLHLFAMTKYHQQ